MTKKNGRYSGVAAPSGRLDNHMAIIQYNDLLINTLQDGLGLFESSLPPYCSCADDFFAVKTLPKIFAVQKKYLKPNDNFNLTWLVYDVDRPTATFDWYDLNCPPPNIIATNPDNGHAHLFYGLSTPVWLQFGNDGKAGKAFRFASAVDVALTAKLQADPAYTKGLAKNPLKVDRWTVQKFQSYLYDLYWLADWLDLGKMLDGRRRLPEVGLGRNCTLFDRTRYWAYRAIRQNWLNFDTWRYMVHAVAMQYNSEFSSPLPDKEVGYLSKSVATWVWDNMSPAGFAKWAENRRKKSILTRQKRLKSKSRLKEIKKLLEQQKSKQEISEMLGISVRRINQLIKDRCL